MFFDKAQQAIARANPSARPAALMFDVDRFKRVNDTYGHDIGDQVLRDISREATSERMIVGRLGGEEFAILLEGSNLAAAIALAEHLRTSIAGLAFDTARGKLAVTCSFGVSEWEQGESIDQLLKRADSALYEAKTGGRNRVVAAQQSASKTDAAHATGIVRSADRSATADQDESPTAPHPGDQQWLARTA
jgi:two-component system cell cycle response regulator